LLFNFRQTDFNQKKTAGQLPFSQTSKHHETSYKKVPWTHSADRQIRSGDFMMLKSKKTNGWLAVNTKDRLPGVDERYMLTTTADPAVGPVSRAVF